MLSGELLKMHGKLLFCVGDCRAHKENTDVAWEPMENERKTQLLRGSSLNARNTLVLRWNPTKNTTKLMCYVRTY